MSVRFSDYFLQQLTAGMTIVLSKPAEDISKILKQIGIDTTQYLNHFDSISELYDDVNHSVDMVLNNIQESEYAKREKQKYSLALSTNKKIYTEAELRSDVSFKTVSTRNIKRENFFVSPLDTSLSPSIMVSERIGDNGNDNENEESKVLKKIDELISLQVWSSHEVAKFVQKKETSQSEKDHAIGMHIASCVITHQNIRKKEIGISTAQKLSTTSNISPSTTLKKSMDLAFDLKEKIIDGIDEAGIPKNTFNLTDRQNGIFERALEKLRKLHQYGSLTQRFKTRNKIIDLIELLKSYMIFGTHKEIDEDIIHYLKRFSRLNPEKLEYIHKLTEDVDVSRIGNSIGGLFGLVSGYIPFWNPGDEDNTNDTQSVDGIVVDDEEDKKETEFLEQNFFEQQEMEAMTHLIDTLKNVKTKDFIVIISKHVDAETIKLKEKIKTVRSEYPTKLTILNKVEFKKQREKIVSKSQRFIKNELFKLGIKMTPEQKKMADYHKNTIKKFSTDRFPKNTPIVGGAIQKFFTFVKQQWINTTNMITVKSFIHMALIDVVASALTSKDGGASWIVKLMGGTGGNSETTEFILKIFNLSSTQLPSVVGATVATFAIYKAHSYIKRMVIVSLIYPVISISKKIITTQVRKIVKALITGTVGKVVKEKKDGKKELSERWEAISDFFTDTMVGEMFNHTLFSESISLSSKILLSKEKSSKVQEWTQYGGFFGSILSKGLGDSMTSGERWLGEKIMQEFGEDHYIVDTLQSFAFLNYGAKANKAIADKMIKNFKTNLLKLRDDEEKINKEIKKLKKLSKKFRKSEKIAKKESEKGDKGDFKSIKDLNDVIIIKNEELFDIQSKLVLEIRNLKNLSQIHEGQGEFLVKQLIQNDQVYKDLVSAYNIAYTEDMKKIDLIYQVVSDMSSNTDDVIQVSGIKLGRLIDFWKNLGQRDMSISTMTKKQLSVVKGSIQLLMENDTGVVDGHFVSDQRFLDFYEEFVPTMIPDGSGDGGMVQNPVHKMFQLEASTCETTKDILKNFENFKVIKNFKHAKIDISRGRGTITCSTENRVSEKSKLLKFTKRNPNSKNPEWEEYVSGRPGRLMEVMAFSIGQYEKEIGIRTSNESDSLSVFNDFITAFKIDTQMSKLVDEGYINGKVDEVLLQRNFEIQIPDDMVDATQEQKDVFINNVQDQIDEMRSTLKYSNIRINDVFEKELKTSIEKIRDDVKNKLIENRKSALEEARKLGKKVRIEMKKFVKKLIQDRAGKFEEIAKYFEGIPDKKPNKNITVGKKLSKDKSRRKVIIPYSEEGFKVFTKNRLRIEEIQTKSDEYLLKEKELWVHREPGSLMRVVESFFPSKVKQFKEWVDGGLSGEIVGHFIYEEGVLAKQFRYLKTWFTMLSKELDFMDENVNFSYDRLLDKTTINPSPEMKDVLHSIHYKRENGRHIINKFLVYLSITGKTFKYKFWVNKRYFQVHKWLETEQHLYYFPSLEEKSSWWTTWEKAGTLLKSGIILFALGTAGIGLGLTLNIGLDSIIDSTMELGVDPLLNSLLDANIGDSISNKNKTSSFLLFTKNNDSEDEDDSIQGI